MGTWKTVILKHFGRKSMKHYETFRVNVTAVDLGIKPAYLYDIGCTTASQLIALVNDLQQEQLILNKLNVLEIGLDYLIVNVAAVLTGDPMTELQNRLIDVSETLKIPSVAESPEIISKLVTVMNEIRHNLDENSVTHYILPEVKCNISSLFGILLNYPVIYWYSDFSDGNCLSMEKLVNVKLSLSYMNEDPHTRLEDNEQIQTMHTSSHTLYSFSYPCCLMEHSKPLVDVWFTKIQDKINQSNCFKNLKCFTEEVILEAVCL